GCGTCRGCGTVESGGQEHASRHDRDRVGAAMSGGSGRTTHTVEPPARGGSMDAATEAFLAHRNLLFTVAYEMLGSAADAEDVLQETWLRWVGVDLATIQDQRAYLVRITTRQALLRLRPLRRRQEWHVGPWPPAGTGGRTWAGSAPDRHGCGCGRCAAARRRTWDPGSRSRC